MHSAKASWTGHSLFCCIFIIEKNRIVSYVHQCVCISKCALAFHLVHGTLDICANWLHPEISLLSVVQY
jgi:hypothetical protein